ncbi:MAG: choice-of-anchor Q domain-containing protein [Rudaea sp.]
MAASTIRGIGGWRLVPLAAALTLAGISADTLASIPLSAPVPTAWKPGDGRAVAALFAALDAVAHTRAPAPPHAAASLAVNSCADDGGSGTLRGVIAAAGEGDSVDLSGLTCSVITLTHGAIPILLDDLTIVGAGADKLAIDGAGLDRVLAHYGYGTLDLQGVTVRDGVSHVTGYHVTGGACIVSNGYVTMHHSAISGCVASGEGVYGGGIVARGIALYTSTLSGNVALGSHPNTFTAAYGGGAMAYRGPVYLYASTVSGNRATHTLSDTHGSYCTGGGIFSDLGGYAYASTFDSNYSYGTGGGIASHAGFGISDSTISGNHAKHKTGGGVFARVFDSMLINNSTIADNTAGSSGGGIYFIGVRDSLTLQSSIVAENKAAGTPADIATLDAFTIAGANNLVIAAAVNVSLPTDTVHGDPKLLPLGDYGGPTRTHALMVGSPGLDAGNNLTGLISDQRGPGFARVLGAATDIGAFEGALAPAPVVPAPGLSLRLAALLAALLGGLGWCSLRRRGA